MFDFEVNIGNKRAGAFTTNIYYENLRFEISFLSINPSNPLLQLYKLQTGVRWVYIIFPISRNFLPC